MTKSIRVNIGGKEYSLKGHDEKLIYQASNEVNNQFDELEAKHPKESAATLSILSALNIAEKYYKTIQRKDDEQSFLINELNNMAGFIKMNLG